MGVVGGGSYSGYGSAKPASDSVWTRIADGYWKRKYKKSEEKRKRLERFLDRLGIEYKDI